MRRLKVLLPMLGMALLGLIISYWPHTSSALNPDHDCSSCHSLHNAPGQTLGSDLVVEDLCLSCHGAGGVSTLKAEVHRNKSGSSYSFSMTCIDCHDPHDNQPNWLGGTNIKQMGYLDEASGLAKVPTPNSGLRDVVFESRGTDAGGPSLHSFADNDEDGNGVYDGACEVCHTLANNHRNNSSGSHSHYTGTDCIVCHPHDAYFQGSGGGCTACHNATPGGRRNVVAEFGMTSHHVAAGTVTDDDCGVCHYEAQGAHADGFVDLINPDTGARLTAFTTFSRNRTSDTLEAMVVDVQNNLCLKCHDSDGATSTNFSGNAMRPFSSGARDVPDVFSRLDTGNSYHHAVRGAGTNTFCNSSTMVAPWNQTAGNHDVISCFDCHNIGGHGSVNQRMLRDPIDFDGMEAAPTDTDLPAGLGAAVETFCTRCHTSSVYLTAGSGSEFEFHGANQNQHSSSGGNDLGCMGCHGGIVTFNNSVPPGGNGAARGNIHGGSFTWPTGTFSAGVSTKYFMVGGWNSGWYTYLNKGNLMGGCGGGDCNHTGSATKNGQKYTKF